MSKGIRRVPFVEIMGCRVDNLTMEESVVAVGDLIATGRPNQHVAVNVDKLVKAAEDENIRRIINRSALVSADGMPVVWASRLLGTPLKARVAGIDLFEALMARAPREGWRVFLLGAHEPVVARVKAIYERRYPGLVVAGYRDGYWRPEEEASVAAQVRDARPHILFVAISSPAKEKFLDRWQHEMQVPFAMGVGGTFDVAAGVVRRAPLWMQRSGLEWFYRFLQEPRRMFARYFVRDLVFFRMLAAELWRRVTEATFTR